MENNLILTDIFEFSLTRKNGRRNAKMLKFLESQLREIENNPKKQAIIKTVSANFCGNESPVKVLQVTIYEEKL